MKRSTKITSIIIIFFLIITAVIVGRTMIGNHFKKKFSKRPLPGIIVTEVVQKEFSEKIESYGTAVSRTTFAGLFAFLKSNGVTSLTLLSVHCALRRTEINNSKLFLWFSGIGVLG